MRPGETPQAALLRLLREGGPEAGILIGFFTANLHALETFTRGLKQGLRGFEGIQGADSLSPMRGLLEALEALLLEEGASQFADAPCMPESMPLPAGLTLTHVTPRPMFVRTSEGVTLALDGISLIVPKKDPPGGGYVYVGNTMHQLFQQRDLEALEGMLEGMTAPLAPEGEPEEVPHAAE